MYSVRGYFRLAWSTDDTDATDLHGFPLIRSPLTVIRYPLSAHFSISFK